MLLASLASHWKVDHGLYAPAEQQRATTAAIPHNRGNCAKGSSARNYLMPNPFQILYSWPQPAMWKSDPFQAPRMCVCPLTARTHASLSTTVPDNMHFNLAPPPARSSRQGLAQAGQPDTACVAMVALGEARRRLGRGRGCSSTQLPTNCIPKLEIGDTVGRRWRNDVALRQ